jgi:ferric-dicitrate binding protein FerR (iron transport regulator)
MKDTGKYTERDWEELAAMFSDERETAGSDIENFSNEDDLHTEKQWREIGMRTGKGEINVDNAWNKLHNRLDNDGLLTRTAIIGSISRRSMFLRIAAAVVIVAGLGAAILYISNTDLLSRSIVFTAGNDQRNIEVNLPDGSKAWLNRNSEISYKPGLGKGSRSVKLTGEAFFDVVHNDSRPFIIDAGNAKVKDIGTSFNVISKNNNDEVEVFVSSGKVMLSDQAGAWEVVLNPGYIGTMSKTGSNKSLNTNKNYLSWKTDVLIYTNEPLKNVFRDFKKIYNINIIADDPEILNLTLWTTYDQPPQDAEISALCLIHHLKYYKEGNIYHLSKK